MITTIVRAILLAVTGAWLLIGLHAAAAQTLPVVPPLPLLPEQGELAEDRLEAILLLGGDYSAAGGAYRFHSGGDYILDVGKLGGGGDIGDPRTMGDSGLKWNPLVNGNIGYVTASSDVPGILAGNNVKIKTLGLELGGGARFWFTDHFSLAPTISGIYTHLTQTFYANTDVGKQYLEPLQNAGLVDYSLDTWTAIPALDAKYEWTVGRNGFYVVSTYKYYHTADFNSSAALDVGGNSQSWGNVLDIDIPLGWTLFGHEMHTGGHLDQMLLFGNLRSGLNSNDLYTVNARLVLDMSTSYPFLTFLGLGASYNWGDSLSGWSVGISARLKL